MTNDTSDTDFSAINEPSAEPSAAAETSSQTLISHAQDSIMNPPQSEETSPVDISSPRVYENNEESTNDLLIVKTFIHSLIKLSQEFLISLDEKEDTNTTLSTMKLKTNEQPKYRHSKETSYHQFLRELLNTIHTMKKQQDSPQQDKKLHITPPQSTHKLQQSLPQQIHNLQKQVEKIYRLQTSQEGRQRNSKRKPETRKCYRCSTYGHIAKNCRRPSVQRTEDGKNRQPPTNTLSTYDEIHKSKTTYKSFQTAKLHSTTESSTVPSHRS